TEAGRLMAWYYITFETVKKFYTISGKETLSDLVTLIASCKEFLDIQLRINEKKTLNTLNKDPHRITIRFPMEGRIKTREMKVNCLIQAQLGCIPIQDFALTQDTAKIFRHGSRITRCITLSNAIVNAGLTSFKKIKETDARELEVYLHKIMDSVLLKAGNWAKKIAVKRALKSEDLSINLLSSEFGMTASKKPGNRECNHPCKSKHTCGHDCCKIGVAQKSEIKESTISSYLSDLRNRNAVSSVPPVKRLKIQMNKSQGVDLKEFEYTLKVEMISWLLSEYLNISEFPIMEQWDQPEIYGKVRQEPSEYQDKGFGNTLSSSTRASKLPLQESKSKFQREMSNEKLCFTCSEKKPKSSNYKKVDFFVRNSECKKEVDFR
ncbi:hypothetical protein EGK_00958, partial [Macaca mulatta]